MSIDAHVRQAGLNEQLPEEPRVLTWREAARERKAHEHELQRLVRRFSRGN